MSVANLPDDAPGCDKCPSKPAATHWCDTCSSLLCAACIAAHPRGHDAAPLIGDSDDNDDVENNDDGVPAGAETLDTNLNLVTGKATAPSTKQQQQQQQHHLVISEEKMSQVLAMFENSSPVELCTQLVRFVPEDYESLKTHHESFASVFAALRVRAFDEMCGFAVETLADNRAAVKAIAEYVAKSSSNNNSSSSASAAAAAAASSASAAFAGFSSIAGVKSVGEESVAAAAASADAGAAAAQHLFARLNGDVLSQLRRGVRLSAQQPKVGTDGAGELLLFPAGTAANKKFAVRDAIPNNGELPAVPGRAGRRVSALCFLEAGAEPDAPVARVTLTFRGGKNGDSNGAPETHDVHVTARNGGLVVYLSGALEGIAVEPAASSDKLCVVAKYFW